MFSKILFSNKIQFTEQNIIKAERELIEREKDWKVQKALEEEYFRKLELQFKRS